MIIDIFYTLKKLYVQILNTPVGLFSKNGYAILL